jgi:threonine aldolase
MEARKDSPLEFGKIFNTISVCLSKGLGCPVGSLLVGNGDDMKKALRIRKIVGGGMRQAGFLAAAGIYALDHHRERLKEDHRRAKEIGEVLKELPFVENIAPIETNIIIFGIDAKRLSEAQFIQRLKEKGILLMGMGKGKLRIVTHLDYTENMHETFLGELRNLSI